MTYNPRILQIENTGEANQILAELKVDPVGIKIMAPKTVQRVIKLEGVKRDTAILIKQEMLAADGEAALSRGTLYSTLSETDVLLTATLKQYQRVIAKLRMQPFECKAIANEIETVLTNYERNEWKIECGKDVLSIGNRTLIMGVLNVTPDSFSDGGRFYDRKAAVKIAIKMVEQGADIIDIGGESTRPGANPISEKEELRRVVPVIEHVVKKVNVPISIDTYKPNVARTALDSGAYMVNDIYGLRMKGMAELIADYKIPVIIMHMLGRPKTMQQNPTYKSVVSDITRFLRERVKYAIKKGISKDKIIIDPGIGFGKKLEHNLEIIRNLSEFKSLGLPILIGPSRKSFIGMILNLPVEERLEGSLAAISACILNGANIVRVHDVKEAERAIKICDALKT